MLNLLENELKNHKIFYPVQNNRLLLTWLILIKKNMDLRKTCFAFDCSATLC